MTALLLAIDASTTGASAFAFDVEGHIVAVGRKPYALLQPAPRAYEQDAQKWWLACKQAIKQVTGQLGHIGAQAIAGLCVTHQRESYVFTDQHFDAVTPAIIWMDSRCHEMVPQLTRKWGADKLRALTGKPACVTPSFYKIAEQLERMPHLRSPDLRLLDVHAYLVAKLCGEAMTSLASADPLGLLDMARGCWAQELISYLKLDVAMLPSLHQPGIQLGEVQPALCGELGLPKALAVIAGGGDGQTAGLGCGITSSHSAYLNLGTAVVGGVQSPKFLHSRAYRTLYACQLGDFYLESNLKGGTFILNWLIDRFCASAPQSETHATLATLERQAASLPAGSEGLVVVPYWNGVMNPHWDDSASGMTIGWRGDHGQHHFYRAILEGIAMEQRQSFRGIEESTTQAIEEFLVVGGGAKSELWCQILADVLAKPVFRTETEEASALGAAVLAAAGVKIYPGLESAAQAMCRRGQRYEQGANATHYDALFNRVYKQIYPSLRSVTTALSDVEDSSSSAN